MATREVQPEGLSPFQEFVQNHQQQLKGMELLSLPFKLRGLANLSKCRRGDAEAESRALEIRRQMEAWDAPEEVQQLFLAVLDLLWFGREQ